MQSLSGGAGALIEFLGRYVRELGGGNDKDKSEAQGGGGGKDQELKGRGGGEQGGGGCEGLGEVFGQF